MSVFWSYARRDEENTGDFYARLKREICSQYEVKYGLPLNVFKDTESIPKTGYWDTAIESALDSHACALLLISPTYFLRKWCRFEARVALNSKNAPLVICIQDNPYNDQIPEDGLELNLYRFSLSFLPHTRFRSDGLRSFQDQIESIVETIHLCVLGASRIENTDEDTLDDLLQQYQILFDNYVQLSPRAFEGAIKARENIVSRINSKGSFLLLKEQCNSLQIDLDVLEATCFKMYELTKRVYRLCSVGNARPQQLDINVEKYSALRYVQLDQERFVNAICPKSAKWAAVCPPPFLYLFSRFCAQYRTAEMFNYYAMQLQAAIVNSAPINQASSPETPSG